MIHILSFYSFLRGRIWSPAAVGWPTWTCLWWRNIIQVPCGPFASFCNQLGHFCAFNLFIPVATSCGLHICRRWGKNKVEHRWWALHWKHRTPLHKNCDLMSSPSSWPTADQLGHMIFIDIHYLHFVAWSRLLSKLLFQRFCQPQLSCSPWRDLGWCMSNQPNKLGSFIFKRARPLCMANVS